MLQPLPKLLKKAEKVVNTWIRKRDEGGKCISCDNPGTQAGHYFPVGGHSALRFDERNINLQCSGCNLYKHGNQAHYRIGLVEKIGEDQVIELELIAKTQRIKKWTREELNQIIQKYKI